MARMRQGFCGGLRKRLSSRSYRVCRGDFTPPRRRERRGNLNKKINQKRGFGLRLWRSPLVEMKQYTSGHRLSLALFITNVIGATIYVFASMASWAIREELAQGVHSTTGEPFVWAVRTWPILICFGLLNLIWILRIKKWRDSYFLAMAAMIWLIAMWIDFAHH